MTCSEQGCDKPSQVRGVCKSHYGKLRLREDPDYLGVARQVQQLALYRDAANAVNVPAGAANMRSSQLLDGKVWDGSDPAGYARSFALHAMSTRASLAARR